MKLMSILLCLFLLSVLFALPGCCFKGGEDCPPEPEVYEPVTYEQTTPPQEAMPQLRAPVASADEQTSADEQYLLGTMKYIPIEGGFWGIVTDTGKKYDPVNLSEEYQKEGLQVKFRAEELKDRVSFHMWGTLVRILEISKR